jgi:hypothetical protein
VIVARRVAIRLQACHDPGVAAFDRTTGYRRCVPQLTIGAGR